MSEHNYATVLFKNNLEKHPEHFTINPEQLGKQIAEVIKKSQAHIAENAEARKDTPRAEYNKLRGELFQLTERCKHFEIYANEWAAQVRMLESKINDVLKQKKAAGDAGNLQNERNLEHQIELLETELLDAKKEFRRAAQQSNAAAKALKQFDGHARIAELKAIIEAPTKE